MIQTDPRRMSSSQYGQWLRSGGNLAKGPVPVGEPPVGTKALTDLSRQLGGDASMANLGPGSPMTPVRTEEGAPRRWDYVPGYNVPTTPRKYEGVDFATLQAFAENYDIARLCIEKRKDDLRSLTWSIRAKPVAGLTRKESKARTTKFEGVVQEVTGFFMTPNQEDPWGSWLVQWAHQLFTIDAATIYLRPTLAGDLYSLEVIDGASIFEIVDEWGRLPQAPDPAYVQVIRGFPSGWWSRDQIIQAPYWQTTNSPYGSPPAEWIMLAANRALRRQTLDLSRFTEGNIPVGFLRAPEGWNMTQIAELKAYLDGLLAGNDVQRSRIVPIPTATTGNAVELMNPQVTTDAEEWLMHITCAAFGVNPRELGFDKKGGSLGGKGDAEVGADISFLRSVRNPAMHLKGILDLIIAGALGQPDLEFWFDDLDSNKDRVAEATINKIYVDAGVLSVDEVRETDLDVDGIGLEAYVMTAQGPIMVADLIAGSVGPAADAERSSTAVDNFANAPQPPDGGDGSGGPEAPSAAPGELTTGDAAGTPAKGDANAPGGSANMDSNPVGKAAGSPGVAGLHRGGLPGHMPPVTGALDASAVAGLLASSRSDEPASATVDLALWQRKSLRALKDGRSPAVRFESDAIDADTATAIGFALAKSTTPDGVRAAFTLVKVGASAGPLVALAPGASSARSSATSSGARVTPPSPLSTAPARPLYPSTLRPDIRGARTSASSSTPPPSSSL